MGRVATLAEVAVAVQNARDQGLAVVLTNGAFDLLHVGHVRYLRAARALAPDGLLVVAVNSDSSARASKGAGRPVVPGPERAEIVAALGMVDWVVLFSESTVNGIIETLRPGFHAKGTDYTEDTVPERDAVLAYGGEVRIVGDDKAHSTSELIARLGQAPG